jgi:hypothetical protein
MKKREIAEKSFHGAGAEGQRETVGRPPVVEFVFGKELPEYIPPLLRPVTYKANDSLPDKWEDIRKRGSVTQIQAAKFLLRDPRTVRRLIQRRELTSSKKGRVACDEKLRHQIRKMHGQHVLR